MRMCLQHSSLAVLQAWTPSVYNNTLPLLLYACHAITSCNNFGNWETCMSLLAGGGHLGIWCATVGALPWHPCLGWPFAASGVLPNPLDNLTYRATWAIQTDVCLHPRSAASCLAAPLSRILN